MLVYVYIYPHNGGKQAPLNLWYVPTKLQGVTSLTTKKLYILLLINIALFTNSPYVLPKRNALLGQYFKWGLHFHLP